MPYTTIFEITQKSYQWWSPAIGLIFVLFGVVLVWISWRWESQRQAKLVGYLEIAFASVWVLMAFSSSFSEYRQCRNAYRTGNYAVVEGRVENFQSISFEGQGECFSVQTQRFCYSGDTTHSGFSQLASHGGPIREGLPVRIAYFDGQILRLEIRAE